MNSLFAGLGVSVFEVMSRLARERDAVNLGQGFPDDPGPADVRAKAAEAVVDGWNQYPPMLGLPELRAAVAAHYRRFQGLELDPEREVMVTSGATEAIAGALLALIEPGDEVVLFQPMYDAYLPLVRRAGGVPKFVTLKPPRWTFDEADLAAAFSDRTRVVLFNNPLNPTGVVYGREVARDSRPRLRAPRRDRASATRSGSTWCSTVSSHLPLMAIEGMRERTVKIGSAGKIFSLTGWKVGFVCAAPALLRVLGQGAPVHHLHHAAEPASGGRLRPGEGRCLFRRHARRLPAQPRSLRRRPRGARFRRPAERRHLFPQRRPRAARLRRRRRLLPRSGRAARRRRNSRLGLLRRGADPHRRALLLRQARRDARRRARRG